MPSHRSLRMAEAIREVVASAILFEVSDPRVRAVTVLRSEVSGDLRTSTVFVSVMGTEGEQRLAMNGLRHASGFLQARVANRLQTRFTPVLTFKFDDSVKKSVEMSRMIEDVLDSDRRARSVAGDPPDSEPADPEPDTEQRRTADGSDDVVHVS